MNLLAIYLVIMVIRVVHSGTVVREMSNDDRQAIVDAHNRLRRTKPARNMQAVNYNLDLERVARNWSAQCIFGHRPARSWEVDGVSLLGENIYADGLEYRSYWRVMIQLWYDEEPCFNLTTGACAPECTYCTHYTQLMFHSSAEVGCGFAHCDSVQNIGDVPTNIFVCNYIQFGNYATNGRLVQPYEAAADAGQVCSNCPPHKPSCDQGLCRAALTTTATAPSTRTGTTEEARTPATRPQALTTRGQSPQSQGSAAAAPSSFLHLLFPFLHISYRFFDLRCLYAVLFTCHI